MESVQSAGIDRILEPLIHFFIITSQINHLLSHFDFQIPSKIKISKVSFKNIRGSSATPLAIKLICSRHLPCDDVKVSNIDLTYNGIKGPITSQCMNVRPIISGKQNPKICSSPYVVP